MKKLILTLFVYLINLTNANANNNNFNQVCNALEQHQIYTNKNENFCLSPYIQLHGKNEYLRNNIAYYVEKNDNNKISKIYLVLNINQPKFKNNDIKTLINLSQSLTKKITDSELPIKFITAIKNKTNINENINDYNIEVKHDIWPTGRGYGTHFIIRPK